MRCFSNWTELWLEVPQGSVLGPLLFNIYINDLFHITELMNVCSYADDVTLYACDSDIWNLIKRLEHDSSSAFERFQSNYMKLNEDKCHFIISRYKHEIMFASIGESRIWEKGQQKFLGVIVDKNLKFKELILKQCKKACKKLRVLGRSLPYFTHWTSKVINEDIYWIPIWTLPFSLGVLR